MSTGENPGSDPVAGVSSLGDPVRRRLYDCVAAHDEPVSRDDAAAAAGISRTLAAYHLDKLTEAGLLTSTYARPAGRSGPGAGRPAKHYARSGRELTVSLPPRNYALLAEIMTQAVSAADASGAVRAALEAAARKAGRAAVTGPDLTEALRACGYEPVPTPDGDIELRNCPFHQVSRSHTELVCGLNLQLVSGLLDAAGSPGQRAELMPHAGHCCVFIHRPDRHRRGLLKRRGRTRAAPEQPEREG